MVYKGDQGGRGTYRIGSPVTTTTIKGVAVVVVVVRTAAGSTNEVIVQVIQVRTVTTVVRNTSTVGKTDMKLERRKKKK